MSKELLKRALKSKKRVPKWPKNRPPKELERSYQKDLLEMNRRASQLMNQIFISQLPKIYAEANEQRPGERLDDAGDAMSTARRLLSTVKNLFSQEYNQTEIERIARKRGQTVSEFSRDIVEKGFKRVAGVDVLLAEPYLKGELQLFTAQNVNLITSLHERTFSEIESKVYSGLSTGTRWENIAEDIQNRFNVSDSRANLIARDQVNKLNGQLTGLRQQELGVTKYIWRTSLDERVRDSHVELEGTEHSWNNPPSEGHPGEPIQCRCSAEPVLDEFFE